jgi:hypothetical protein
VLYQNPDLYDTLPPVSENQFDYYVTLLPVMRVASQLYGEITVEETSDYDTLSQVNRATWFISTPEQRDAWVAPLHLRWIFAQELSALVAANGFRLERRDGDYSGGDFTSESRLQVCQCRPI